MLKSTPKCHKLTLAVLKLLHFQVQNAKGPDFGPESNIQMAIKVVRTTEKSPK
jgi:hypothetical protein